MKKSFMILILFITILVIVIIPLILFLVIKSYSKGTFNLYAQEGDIYYKIDEEYKKLDENQIELKDGVMIKTEEGSCHIILKTGSIITIGNNSELKINKSEEKISISLNYGTIWNRINNDKDFKINFDDIQITTEGTIFSVEKDEDQYQIIAIKNNINILDSEESLNISEGNYYDSSFTKFESEEVASEILNSSWYLENRLLDELFLDGDLDKYIINREYETSTEEEENNIDAEENQISQNEGKTETDIEAENFIQTFFEYIDNDEPDKAVLMMSDNMVGTDPIQSNSTMQAFAVAFNEWDRVEVNSIEEGIKDDWTMNVRTYKVTFTIQFKDTPEYGTNWDEGENTRWIRLLRTNEGWNIDEIATSP